MTPRVSIIIPTNNSARTLGKCLRSIEGQTYDDVEVVVVDAHSTDGTREICTRFESVSVLVEDAGIATARVTGAEAAEGEYYFHVDADMYLPDRLVAECVRKLERGREDALVIAEENVGESFWADVWDVEKDLFRTAETGNARFVRAATYWECGGHTPGLLGKEDADFHNKLVNHGASVGFVSLVIEHDVGAVGLRDILRDKWRYAASIPDEGVTERADGDHRREVLKGLPSVMRRRPASACLYGLIVMGTIASRTVTRYI